MSLTNSEINIIVNELQRIILGSVIQKVSSIDEETFLIRMYKNTEYVLLTSLTRDFVRMHLTNKRYKALKTPTNFCLFLKKHIEGLYVENIETIKYDRIVKLHFSAKDIKRILVLELFNVKGNAFLCDENYKILYAMNQNIEYQDQQYIEPDKIPEKSNDKEPEQHEDRLYNESVDDKYYHLVKQTTFDHQKKGLKKVLMKELKRLKRLKSNLTEDLNKMQKHAELRKKGELLKSYFHLIKPGMHSVNVTDYTQGEGKDIEISLQPNLSASENINKYFEKAKKYERGISKVERQINDTNNKLAQIQDWNEKQEQISSFDQFNDLIKEIQKDRYGKKIKQNLLQMDHKQERKTKNEPFPKFYSEKGIPLYIGRNAKENDKLTISFARGNDYFFHVNDYAGFHVIARIAKNEELDHETLLDAANLALNYSKAKKGGEAEVLYTKKKYISKSKNMPPGKVNVSKFKTINILLDDNRIKRLKESREINE